MSRRAVVFLIVVLFGAGVYGCRKAKIDAPTEPLRPAVSVRELPQSRPGKERPWYQDLMPTAAGEPAGEDKDRKAAPKDRPWVPVDTPVEPLAPASSVELESPPPPPPPPTPPTPTTMASARADAQVLVDELRERIEAERTADAAWSLLRLELHGTGSEKHTGLSLIADVGLTSLYVNRAEVLFEQLRFEDCMNRLARMAGLRYAQSGRWGNPLVTWRQENVSVYDAARAIAKEHGFSVRFTAAGTRFTFPLARYEARERFVGEVTRAVLDYGRQMVQKMPTLVISLAPTPSKTDPEKDAALESGKKTTKESLKNAKQ